MNKLNDAIGHFTRWSVENGDRNAEYLAAALEEIRDLLTTHDNQIAGLIHMQDVVVKKVIPEEQPATFEPWDCVRAKEGTYLYECYADAELVCGFIDSDGDRKVFNPNDDSDRGAFHCDDSDLIFMRRLQPRAQATDYDTEPTFAARYINDAQAEPQPKAPEAPVNSIFKMGDRVDWSFKGLTEQGTINHDWGNGYYDVTFEYGEKGRIETIHRSHLTFAGKPATRFNPGDHAWDSVNAKTVEIISITGTQAVVQRGNASQYMQHVDNLTPLIAAKLPRFTFGDRVRVEHDSDKMLFLYYDDDTRLGPGRAICVNQRASICNVPAEKLLLDTAAD